MWRAFYQGLRAGNLRGYYYAACVWDDHVAEAERVEQASMPQQLSLFEEVER